jgi:N utilization substance protein B
VSPGRRSARRQAVFVLYQQDLLGLSLEAALQRIEAEELSEYARELVLGVGGKREDIDALLESYVEGWTLDRLGTLERSILRIATYELLREADVPKAVAIDQAVELAKRFCSDEAAALVNGVLGSMASARGAVAGGSPAISEDD